MHETQLFLSCWSHRETFGLVGDTDGAERTPDGEQPLGTLRMEPGRAVPEEDVIDDKTDLHLVRATGRLPERAVKIYGQKPKGF